MFLVTLLVTGIFLFLSGIHVFWAFGNNQNSSAVIPTRDSEPLFKPSTATTLLVAFALLMAAIIVLIQTEILNLPIPDWIGNIGIWVLVAVFGLRAIGDFRYVGFFKRVRGTKFAQMDTRIYSPLCVFIAVMTALIALT